MRYEMLGRLRVSDGQHDASIGPQKIETLFAVLLQREARKALDAGRYEAALSYLDLVGDQAGSPGNGPRSRRCAR
jgi:hypothetical protein